MQVLSKLVYAAAAAAAFGMSVSTEVEGKMKYRDARKQRHNLFQNAAQSSERALRHNRVIVKLKPN